MGIFDKSNYIVNTGMTVTFLSPVVAVAILLDKRALAVWRRKCLLYLHFLW